MSSILGDAWLIVATERISAFDCIMPNGIPGKGKILTAMSPVLVREVRSGVENHLISTRRRAIPGEGPSPFADHCTGRSMLVKKATVVPIECVARGYLAGSGWKEYQQSQTVCGVKLPPGCAVRQAPGANLNTGDEGKVGHDINVSVRGDGAARRRGDRVATLRSARCRSTSRPPTTPLRAA
jgi:phosphoribosylaminoimidazole-succinocarboxamide synthase